jgi:hypothetical protein
MNWNELNELLLLLLLRSDILQFTPDFMSCLSIM